MFGRKQMIPGKAVVVSVSFNGSAWRNTGAGTFAMDYVLDVTPSDGEPFRAQVTARIWEPSPKARDEVKVRCDPIKKKAEFDLDGDPRFDQKLVKAKQEAEHEAVLAAPVGTPSAEISSPGQKMEVERLKAKMQANQQARGLQGAGGAAAPRWMVPTECPNCGAKVEQATKSFEDNPHCDFCGQPLPVEPGKA